MVGVALLGAARALLPDTEVFFRRAVAPGTPRMAGAAGTAAALALTGLVAELLLGVQPHGPATFVIVPPLLALLQMLLTGAVVERNHGR